METSEEVKHLRQQGHRLTPQRFQVLNVIKTSNRHVTAEEIHTAIVPQQPYIDIATVYRSLQWLQSVGLVAPIPINGKLYYEYHPLGDCHHHLVCQTCGQHIQIPDECLAELKSDIQQRYGFTLHIDHLALIGQCGGCTPEPQPIPCSAE